MTSVKWNDVICFHRKLSLMFASVSTYLLLYATSIILVMLLLFRPRTSPIEQRYSQRRSNRDHPRLFSAILYWGLHKERCPPRFKYQKSWIFGIFWRYFEQIEQIPQRVCRNSSHYAWEPPRKSNRKEKKRLSLSDSTTS